MPRFSVFIGSDHPALPGHFPNMPVVPGVVLLNQVIAHFHQQWPQWRVIGINKLKFLRMLFPEQVFTLEFSPPELHAVRFKCWQDSCLLAEGRLSLQANGLAT